MLSVVVPVYNEGEGLSSFNQSLIDGIKEVTNNSYEIIYCNDGSTDDSLSLMKSFCESDQHTRLISFSRNFGKEIATTAGINHANGQAILTIDADGQHPIKKIPEFIEKWSNGARVVIGIRTANQKEGLTKKLGSKLFYRLFRLVTGAKLIPGSSDFRLIDSSVQVEFRKLTERSRITRGLIDWLGYDREFVHFKANPRLTNTAGYSFKKLFKLAVDSVVSMSRSPLYISAYLGFIIMPLSLLTAVFMIGDALASDPLGIKATGSAYLVVLLVFLVGVLLVSQGIIGLYLSHIHTETQNRPIYIIDKQRSIRLNEDQV
jgi:glycosyltransferase involved in cell wall biosynthesis